MLPKKEPRLIALRKSLALLACAMLSVAAAAEPAAISDAKLVLAGPISLWDRRTVALVFSKPVDKATLADPKNFAFDPFLIVEAATPDVEAGNIVRLRLSAETPLLPSVEYDVRLKSGKDGDGKALDAFLLHKHFTVRTIDGEVANILRHQLPDGAVSVGKTYPGEWRAGEPVRVIPYFSCFALAGLLRGVTMTDDPRGLDATRRYLLWHEEHMGEHGYINDYRGAYPDYPSTGDFDSTDSYGAFFAWLNWSYYLHTGDEAFLRARYPAIQAAAGAIDSTLQPDGLTWAKPSYIVKYTMDNAEVFRGYFTASQVARYMGDTAHYEEWKAKAYRVREAIQRELFLDDPVLPHYVIAKMNDDSLRDEWKDYYPAGMANDLPLLCIHHGTDERAKRCWNSVKTSFLKGYVPSDGVEWFMPRVAALMGERTAQDASYLKSMEMHAKEYLSLNSGHLLELTYTDRPYAVGARRTPGAEAARTGADPWQGAPALQFHVLGPMVGFDNLRSSRTDAPAEQKDSVYTVRFLHDGKSLRIHVAAIDTDLQAGKTAGEGDGISRLFLRGAKGSIDAPVTLLSAGEGGLTFSGADGVVATGEKTKNGYALTITVSLAQIGLATTDDGVGVVDFDFETQDVGKDSSGAPLSVRLGLTRDQSVSRLLLKR